MPNESGLYIILEQRDLWDRFVAMCHHDVNDNCEALDEALHGNNSLRVIVEG